MINNQLGWFIMELPVLVLVTYYLFRNGFSFSSETVLLLLFIAHYVNRVFIYPVRLRTKGKKMPLIIVLSAVVFNLVNGSIIGYYLTHHVTFAGDYFFSLSFIIGAVLFLLGLIINWKSDTALIKLRSPDETGYKVPTGGLFDVVSCPNFFGEIVEWLGFAIMCGNLAGWSFFVWTFANLVPRAIDHHRWYRNHFSEYPEKRKAIIPFVL
jgi:steroid 5-alpha reductase family enzyme